MKKLKEIQVVDELAFALEIASFGLSMGLALLAVVPQMMSSALLSLGDKLNKRRRKKGESLSISEAATMPVVDILMFAIDIVLPDSWLYPSEASSKDGGADVADIKESDQIG